MEEIRRAGQACYDNMSSLEKEKVKQMFDSCDVNGDGYISYRELANEFTNSVPDHKIRSFFSVIDTDGNGFLDFSEFLTLHYVISSRPQCDCCRGIITGLYFCCVRCWEKLVNSRVAVQSYDICSECYDTKSFTHEHQEFLDNFMLLRSGAQQSRREEKALEAGRLYFKFLSGPELNAAHELFGAMDQNGDGRVHSNEVIDFLIRIGVPSTWAQKVFDNMGLMQNSYLTLEDVVAFWYVLVNRVVCDGCSDMITGSYYTCETCFHAHSDGGDTHTYDLCIGCYSNYGKYDPHREHGIFVDNTAMLLHLKDQKRSGASSSTEAQGKGTNKRQISSNAAVATNASSYRSTKAATRKIAYGFAHAASDLAIGALADATGADGAAEVAAEVAMEVVANLCSIM